MASSKDYLDFILEQLSELDDITYRAMMGEYIIYYRGYQILPICMRLTDWMRYIIRWTRIHF